MRDSNHSFPSLNRACVSISSSLYDRRAIDSPVPTLPLLTSLQHLAYLTSTSPRIREILTVDGGLERLISIVERCIDIAYPERARKDFSSSSSSSSPSSNVASTSTATHPARTGSSTPSNSRPTSSDRKGKQPERHIPDDGTALDNEDEMKPFVKKMVPFKAFSTYANYPFSLDSDSDEDEDSLQGQEEDVNMDITPSGEETLSASMLKKTQRTALTAHEREIKLLQLEKTFMKNFVSEYKDLPALVHTYGFALQCLVNVGVRGSESIRTRVVEAGVLGVVARILSGFLDYRATEREKRQTIISAAQAEKEKGKELSMQINGGNNNSSISSRRERHTSTNTSGESDVTAVLTMSTRRERRERDQALLAAQAQTLAMAQAQISAHQHQYSLAQAQQTQYQQQQHHFHTTPLVAGMPAPPNAAAIASATLATPRQTRSAAVQALLNSNTEMPTRAPRQYASNVIPPPTSVRISPRRAGSSSSTASSSSHHQQLVNTNLSSTTSSSATTVATISSLVAGSIMINRTNTPDTIASLDEVQEFSDVNADENESTTSSGQEENGGGGSSIDVDSIMDVIGSNEAELQSTSAMVLGSNMLSNPASRSVSRNRINANILAQHRPVPPPSSRLHDAITPIEPLDPLLATAPAAQHLEATLMQVQAPSMMGDVTIKLASPPQDNAQDEHDEQEDVVMERDNDRDDQESTDDTGTSASPVSRPASSHYMRHHQQQQQEPTSPSSSSSSRRTALLNTTTSNTRRSTHHPIAAQQMTRSDSTNSLLNGMMMDSELTPISRPILLRRQSSSSAIGPATTVTSATPRNAFSLTTITHNDQHEQQQPPVSYNFLSHATAVSSQLETHLRSQTLTAQAPSASQMPSPPLSSSSTTRQPHTSIHAHLRLHPHLQQSAAAQPSIMRDGHAHLLLNYGPLMDHYVKEEDVLHCLHLLAYLSKYPHVRAVFHDPENEICRPPSSSSSTSASNAAAAAGDSEAGNADTSMVSNRTVTGNTTTTRGKCCSCARKKIKFGGQTNTDDGAATSSSASAASMSAAEDGDNNVSDSAACNGHCHAHAGDSSKAHSRSTSSGSQKHGHPCCAKDEDHNNEDQEEAESLARARAMATMPAKDRKPALEPSRPPKSTINNVFSLVEQYTFRPSSPADKSMRLGTDIQYWAGVIMRNACRKDELRGGIRQCANMGCGVWERFPREFAKCRRCRKAKYCSKGCQRRAWQAGHRYWCSARQDAPPAQASAGGSALASTANDNAADNIGGAGSDNDEEIEGVLPVAPFPRGVGLGNAVPGNPTGVIDGITVGGEDGNNDAGGFDARIRMEGGNGEIGMLDSM